MLRAIAWRYRTSPVLRWLAYHQAGR